MYSVTTLATVPVQQHNVTLVLCRGEHMNNKDAEHTKMLCTHHQLCMAGADGSAKNSAQHTLGPKRHAWLRGAGSQMLTEGMHQPATHSVRQPPTHLCFSGSDVCDQCCPRQRQHGGLVQHPLEVHLEAAIRSCTQNRRRQGMQSNIAMQEHTAAIHSAVSALLA